MSNAVMFFGWLVPCLIILGVVAYAYLQEGWCNWYVGVIFCALLPVINIAVILAAVVTYTVLWTLNKKREYSR